MFTFRMTAGAIAAVALLVSGLLCSPLSAQDSGVGPATKRPAKEAGGKDPAAEGAKPESPIKDAKFTLDDVQRREAEVEKTLHDLRNHLERLRPNDWAAEKATIATFRKLIATLQAQGRNLVDAEADFQFRVRAYKEALDKAPTNFRRASTEYLKLAEAEKFEELRRQYSEMAASAQVTAGELEKRSRDVDAKAAEIALKLQFVRHAVKLAGHMDEFLALVPDTQKAAELSRFIQSVDAFIGSFKQAVDQFREFHDRRAGNPSVSPAP